jgi:hypothetical protein
MTKQLVYYTTDYIATVKCYPALAQGLTCAVRTYPSGAPLGTLLMMPSNISLGYKGMNKELSYYTTDFITTVKCFTSHLRASHVRSEPTKWSA